MTSTLNLRPGIDRPGTDRPATVGLITVEPTAHITWARYESAVATIHATAVRPPTVGLITVKPTAHITRARYESAVATIRATAVHSDLIPMAVASADTAFPNTISAGSATAAATVVELPYTASINATIVRLRGERSWHHVWDVSACTWLTAGGV